MRRSLTRLLSLVAALAGAALSCGREITGPAEGREGPLPSFAPRIPAWLRAGDGSSLVAFERVRIVVRRSSGEVALAETVTMPSTADSITLSLQVPLSPSAPEAGEAMSLTLAYVNLAGDTVFRGGPVAVVVRPLRAGETAPDPVDVELTYTGTGAQATRVAISPKTATVFAGDPSFQFSAQAFDAQDVIIAGTPKRFRSSDTSVVSVTEDGLATARAKRGTVSLIAALYTGQEDTATVSVLLRASALMVVSGEAQSGTAGAPLAEPVVVRAVAPDGVPVAGVPVTFTAAGGGAPVGSTVLTDVAGNASAAWTLGPTPGPQTLTATSPGLTGSPRTFTATASAGVATQLAFSTQPASGVAGAPIVVVVEARTAAGFLATGFTGTIDLALASNPTGATLGGTVSVAAVNGVATFNTLSLTAAAAGYTLAASASGLVGATSTAFNISAGAATALAFTVQPVGGNPGTPIVPSPVVGALDAFGNAAALATPVTIALGANPGGAILSGTTTVAPTANLSAFTDLSLDQPATGYTLVATATGLTAATSDPFAIGAAVNAWTNASGGAWSTAANWSLGRVPSASDIVQIQLSGTYTVTLDVSPSVSVILLGGATGTQTLAMSGRTLTVGDGIDVGVNGVLAPSYSTIDGPGVIINDGRVTLVASSLALGVDNRALLEVSGNSSISGGLSNEPGAMLRVAQVDGSTSLASLTLPAGVLNYGTIELSTTYPAPYSSQLVVSGGTLINASSGVVRAVAGAVAGGSRVITATVDNQGLLETQVPLTLNGGSAVHVNSGTVDLSVADLTVSQGGATPSFTNVGAITIGAGRRLALSGGTLSLAAGAVSGAGTLAVTSATLQLGQPFSNAVTGLELSYSIVAGTGALTNAAGRTLTLVATSVTTALDNQGILVASGNSAVSGALTMGLGSELRIGQVDGSTSLAHLTVASGFTNNGTIDLSVYIGIGYSSQLTVTSGALVNAPGATIRALAGGAAGGSRTLTGRLDNQGDVVAQVPLLLNGVSAAHLNSGTIDVTAADITLTQGGTTPSFTNTGAITIGAGRRLSVNGGTLALTGGSVTGAGTLALASATLQLGQPFSNAVTGLELSYSIVAGTSALTNSAGRTLTLIATSVTTALDNQGILVASGNSAVSGALTMGLGSELRIGQVDGSTSLAHLTVASGFTNNGTIDLSVYIGIGYSSQLTVTSGTLVNAPGATIRALAGAAGGGARTIVGPLDNQGAVEAQVPLTLNGSSAVHSNTGTIDLTIANLAVNQGGAGASFTNSGTITLAAGRTFAVSGGSFTNAAGATITAGQLSLANGSAQFLGAMPAVASLSMTSVNATFASPLDAGTTSLGIAYSTVAGPGPFTIPVGASALLLASTLAMPVDVQGTLLVSGNSAISGALTTGGASLIRIGQVDGATSLAHLTVANGFTNTGVIELTVTVAIAYSAQLTVTSGVLVNAGTMAILPGAAAGGTRYLAAALENQGNLIVSAPFVLTSPGADHVNTGAMDLTGADMTVSQSGTTPTFTNAGAVTIGAGRTLTISGGSFSSEVDATLAGGTLSLGNLVAAFNDGTPTGISLVLNSVTASFLGPISTAATTLTIASSTLNGAGPFVNDPGQTLTLRASTINMPVVNQGTLLVTQAATITGALTTAAGSTIRIGQLDGASSLAHLTVSSGFTNSGAIELTTGFAVAYGAQLTVSTGTLLNAAGGSITTLNGLAGGGARTIAGAVDNQGTITVGPGTAGRLDITGSLVTSGVLELEVGGTTPDTQFDRIVVAGTPGSLSLGGTLSVALINAFTPASGNTFAILSALARTGTFATTNLPAGITTPPTYGATGVSLVAP